MTYRNQKNLTWLVGIAGAAGVTQGVCCAQEVGSRAWFEKTWQLASDWKPAQPLHIQVSFERRAAVSNAEVEKARGEAAGEENGGPLARRVKLLELDRANPVMRWTADICTDGTRTRYGSTDHTGAAALQFALGRDTDWSITDATFLRIAPAVMEKPEYGVRNFAATAESVVRATLWAGFGDATGKGRLPCSSEMKQGEWTGGVSIGGKTPPISILRGRAAVNGEPSIAGMVVERRYLADEKHRNASPLGRTEYSRWEMNEVLGRPVVQETRWLDSAGNVTLIRRLEKLEFVPVAVLDELMKIPAAGGRDQWAGETKITTVQDVRPEHLSQTSIEGGVERPVAVQIPLDAPVSPSVYYVVVAPLVLAGGALVLAWRMRRFC